MTGADSERLQAGQSMYSPAPPCSPENTRAALFRAAL